MSSKPIQTGSDAPLESAAATTPPSPIPVPLLPLSIPRTPKTTSAFPAAGTSPTTSQPGTADQLIKPVFLKGLFSVLTTSTKHPSVIRSDLIRVLERIGVKWSEVKGALECTHFPSIDYQTVIQQQQQQQQRQRHRSRSPGPENILNAKETDRTSIDSTINKDLPPLPSDSMLAAGSRTRTHRRDFSGSSLNSSVPIAVVTPAQGTGVGVPNLVVCFEIYIVKVPWVPGVHGVQFRRVSGDPWMYKNMCSQILGELRL